MKNILIAISFSLLTFSATYANHVPGNDTSIILGKLFSRLVSSREDEDKLRINDSIITIIDSYARSDSVMEHNFKEIKYLGQISARNSDLKIITWNLLLSGTGSRYYCYFINRSGKNINVRKLESVYHEKAILTDTEYSEKDWYGALYYDLRQYKKDNQNYWILLGIDYGNPSLTRKIIDIVSFSAEGEAVFGKKIFLSGKETKYREVLEYSTGAVISLKFVSDKSIVFDHLVPLSPELTGQREFYGPDFSYDTFNLEKGIWVFTQNIDARNKRN